MKRTDYTTPVMFVLNDIDLDILTGAGSLESVAAGLGDLENCEKW